MSDDDRQDDGKVGAFLLGFLFGVFVCLAGGGVLFLAQSSRQMAAEAAARDMAEEAKAQRDLAEQALREAKEAAEKPNN
ncbi:MAG: hypothetical protein U0797_06340 [Gemmataceae bacterium]